MRGKAPWIATSCSAAIFLLALMPLASARNNFKTIHRFKGQTDGANPFAGLISDSVGNLYGTTTLGGLYGQGTVFELTPNANGTWSETLLHSFPATDGDGALPFAGLMLDTAGILFGMTRSGGAQGTGAVYELVPNKDGSWSANVLYSFTGGEDGANPQSALISDVNGDLFGTTVVGGGTCSVNGGGCGVVFELTPGIDGSWSERVIHSFNSNGSDGFYPSGALIFDAKGWLCGTTIKGGQHGLGTVFQLVPRSDGTWREHLLHSFNRKDGEGPEASLILDDEGSLYGNTELGGAYELGVAFKLTPDGKGGWKERVLHSFQFNGTDGYNPFGSLVLDNLGGLYGTTAGGGAFSFGMIFRLTPTVDGQWEETVLHAFRDRPGCAPFGGLLLNPQGVFFGTTNGCPDTLGSVFELTP